MTKAIIMCAGESTRTHPLTLTRPKPLLPLLNKPILFHTFDQLEGLVSEIVLIVGYKQEMIREVCKDSYKGIPISYVEQTEQKGTGHALLCARDHITEKILVMNGDDLFHADDIKECLSHDAALLVSKVDNPENFGVIVSQEGKVTSIVEKSQTPPTNDANVGVYVLSESIVTHLDALEVSPRGELELTDALMAYAQELPITVCTLSQYWLPIGYPWDLLNATEFLIKNIKGDVQGTVEDGATLKGEVIVGKGTLIKAGSYIEGPAIIGENCEIGPNCYIRPGTVLGNKCKISNATEVKNSIYFEGAVSKHLSYVGDSILGSNVNLGAGTKVANIRHNKENVKSPVKGKLIDTGRRKLGFIMGDNVKTGINTLIYPGRKLWPNVHTIPGEIVQKDKME